MNMSMTFTEFKERVEKNKPIVFYKKPIKGEFKYYDGLSDNSPIAMFFDTFVLAIRKGIMPSSALRRSGCFSSVTKEKEGLIKDTFFNNRSLLSYKLHTVPDEVNTFKDFCLYSDYFDLLFYSAILSEKDRILSLKTNSEEELRKIRISIADKVSPYIKINEGVNGKKSISLFTLLWKYMDYNDKCISLKDFCINTKFINFNLCCRQINISKEIINQFNEYLLEEIKKSEKKSSLKNCKETKKINLSDFNSDLTVYIKNKLKSEYSLSKNIDRDYTSFKYNEIWNSDLCVPDYSLKTYLDLIDGCEERYLHILDIPEIENINLYSLDLLFKKFILELYIGKTVTIDRVENKFESLLGNIIEANPSLDNSCLVGLKAYFYYRFLLILDSFEYYYFPRSFFELESSRLLYRDYGNLVCLYTNSTLDTSFGKKTRRFFNCLRLKEGYTYKKSNKKDFAPECYYVYYYKQFYNIIFTQFLKRNPNISFSDFCDTFPWFERTFLAWRMYEEIQNNLSWEINETDGIVDESNWTKVASSSFLKALKNSAKCVCLGDSFINIDLTFNDEPSTAYSKNNSLKLIREMCEKANRDKKVKRALNSKNKAFDMYEDRIILENSSDVSTILLKLNSLGYHRTEEEINVRMDELGIRRSLNQLNIDLLVKETMRTGDINATLKKHLPDRTSKSLEFIKNDKGIAEKAIYGLHLEVEEKDRELKSLTDILSKLKDENFQLKNKISDLENSNIQLKATEEKVLRQEISFEDKLSSLENEVSEKIDLTKLDILRICQKVCSKYLDTKTANFLLKDLYSEIFP